MSIVIFDRTAALFLVVGLALAGGGAAWLCGEDDGVLHYVFLIAAIVVAVSVELWRGRRFSSMVVSTSAGLYFWWLAGHSLIVGAVGIGRTVPTGTAHRTEWPLVFWLILSIYAIAGLAMLLVAASEYRASRRMFQ